MKRTCPPPTSWRSIQIGDRIRFQGEGMPVEIEDTIALRQNGMLVTEGGREILPEDYILRVAAPDQILVPRPEETAEPVGVDPLCDELEGIGQATATDVLQHAQSLANRISDRIDDLVLDLRAAKRWLDRRQG